MKDKIKKFIGLNLKPFVGSIVAAMPFGATDVDLWVVFLFQVGTFLAIRYVPIRYRGQVISLAEQTLKIDLDQDGKVGE